ncbi:hypothetical protein GN958_ATG17305 [Phytophthora infestans]|uniref:Uncharacterized protein n=1 Tax=Phytophthora infestans TaxID=4787 RepID=A0A8S9TYH8_PHYIN|nr:hypothetical protein GN958_ATG17305 [Phytophthora infestans]
MHRALQRLSYQPTGVQYGPSFSDFGGYTNREWLAQDINNVDAEPTQNKAEEEESDEPDDRGEEDWSDSDDADDISRDEEVLTGESEPEEQEAPSEEQGHNAKAAKRARLDHRAGMAAAAQVSQDHRGKSTEAEDTHAYKKTKN